MSISILKILQSESSWDERWVLGDVCTSDRTCSHGMYVASLDMQNMDRPQTSIETYLYS